MNKVKLITGLICISFGLIFIVFNRITAKIMTNFAKVRHGHKNSFIKLKDDKKHNGRLGMVIIGAYLIGIGTYITFV